MMSKRMTIMVAIVALMVAMFATVAYAATIHGTNANDSLYETPQNDQMSGRGGNDFLDAVVYDGDIDKLDGGGGSDELNADEAGTGDPLDVLDGGKGDDSCYGDPYDTFVRCESIHVTP
jgi:Ca2+-binding RTX toxin-like protein